MARYDQEDREDDLLGNMVVLGVSLVVIAAVVIGVVAGIDNPKDEVGTGNNNTTLDAICAQTDYKESCISSLKPVGNQSEVIVYFKAAVNATVSEIALVMEKLKVDGGTLSDEGERMALQDCIELLDLCTKELEYVNMLVNSTPTLFYNDSADARSSLSAVITYQRTCREGFKDQFESTYNMERVLQRSSKLSSNALAIIYEHSENDDKKAESLVPPRRSTNELQGGLYDQGYPAQMILAGDRKLLQYYSFRKLDGDQAPNAVVAQDGSGQYTSIFAAIHSYPNDHKGRYLIYVKSGVYFENVIIAKNMPDIFMYGDGLNKTIIAGVVMGGTAYRRATLSVIGDGFFCKDIGITVPTQYGGYTAAAVKVLSDKAAFFNCRIIGTTSSAIFALAHRQFFGNCEIYGATNIVSGDAALVIQHSDIIVRESNLDGKASVIASQARSGRRESTGFVIHGCTIYRDKSNNNNDITDQTPQVKSASTTYLGKAAQKYSRIIVMESSLGDLIRPEGWYGIPDDRNHATELATFVEYGNKGPGAQAKMRVNWPAYAFISNRDDVLRYTAGRFIQAQKWLQGTVVSFQEGFFS